jgi:hypothetical protein
MRPKNNLIALLVLCLFCTFSCAIAASHKTVTAQIEIKAPPEAVFEAIRKERNDETLHRKLESYDGKTAIIKEHLENVAIYGQVDCLWQESEEPYKRIDYKLLSSNKFKEAFGHYDLVAEHDGKSTLLEMESFIDAGMNIPFAAEMTRLNAAKDARVRLERIKKAAEAKTELSSNAHGN